MLDGASFITQGTMSKERKQLVKEAFKRLDKTGK